METESYLSCLPTEVVMCTLLPHLDIQSLNTLSAVSNGWQETVSSYLASFNKVIQTEVSLTNKLFFSSAHHATNLVKLVLIWNTDSRGDNESLDIILNANKNLTEIDLTTTENGWISTQIVKTMAIKLPNLRNVSFSSSRIRLYLENDSRKLWPHVCWGEKRVPNKRYVDIRETDPYYYDDKLTAVFKSIILNECGSEESKILSCLRLLHSKCHLYDYSHTSEHIDGEEVLDPLVFHEYRCPRGLFYNSLLEMPELIDSDVEEDWPWVVDTDSESD